MQRIGLALGGGGAKGLAHIPMLEVFDELDVRPHLITGTSIGSIMGALYASGITGSRIREGVKRMIISKGDSFRASLKKKDVLQWLKFLDVDIGPRGLFKGDKFIEFLYDSMGTSSFEELKIPLKIIATDFWSAEQVVLESGPLLPAVKASMGLPGVFTPVTDNDRVLIDGGGVNPVPHDLLQDCDVTVAVDVMGSMKAESGKVPNLFRAVLGTFDIMQNSIITAKRQQNPPDIYIRPDIVDVDILDFYKARRCTGRPNRKRSGSGLNWRSSSSKSRTRSAEFVVTTQVDMIDGGRKLRKARKTRKWKRKLSSRKKAAFAPFVCFVVEREDGYLSSYNSS